MMHMVTIRRLNRRIFGLRQFSSRKNNVKQAGILVIGDEILKGEVIDTNSPVICTELFKLGVKVRKISVIGDNIKEISDEVKLFSQSFNYVITTGGIGPTHDDVTFEGIADAFNVPLETNPHLLKLCSQFYKTSDENHPGMKLARIPQNATLTFSDKSNYPNISIQNVYIFPGIPELFLRSFLKLCSQLFSSDGCKFYTKYIFVNVTEDKISDELGTLVKEFPDVQFGSYPELLNQQYKVKISIESMSEEDATEAFNRLISSLPKDAIVAKG